MASTRKAPFAPEMISAVDLPIDPVAPRMTTLRTSPSAATLAGIQRYSSFRLAALGSNIHGALSSEAEQSFIREHIPKKLIGSFSIPACSKRFEFEEFRFQSRNSTRTASARKYVRP